MTKRQQNQTVQVLEFIKTAGRPVHISEVQEACELPSYPGKQPSMVVSQIISKGRATARGDWKHIIMVGRGLYQYIPERIADPSPQTAQTTPQWTEVGRLSTGVVLRSPDGTVYLARPLDDVIS